jgi:hypothetical protein
MCQARIGCNQVRSMHEEIRLIIYILHQKNIKIKEYWRLCWGECNSTCRTIERRCESLGHFHRSIPFSAATSPLFSTESASPTF